MRKIYWLALQLSCVMYGWSSEVALIERTQVHMATFVTITLQVNHAGLVDRLFEKVQSLEDQFSSFNPRAQLAQLNHNKMINEASFELIDILRLSLDIYKETYGYFDIGIGMLTKKLYRFGYENAQIPSAKDLGSVHIVHDTFTIEKNRITLQESAMLDLGGIAKGYTVDVLAKELKAQGSKRFKIALSGDIYCQGSCAIAIRSPFEKDAVERVLHLKDSAISTSGNYERYIKSKKYNHLLNPKTKVSQQNIASMTLVSKKISNARLDAYATALSVMPNAQRAEFLKEHRDIDYVIIFNDGKVQDSFGTDHR